MGQEADHLVSACKAGSVVHADCAVLQRAVYWELADALLDAALGDLPRPCQVPDLYACTDLTADIQVAHAAILPLKITHSPMARIACPSEPIILTWDTVDLQDHPNLRTNFSDNM